MNNDLLDKLKQAADDYVSKEKKILNAEYDFLDAILKARGFSKLEQHNNEKAGEILIKSILDFLES